MRRSRSLGKTSRERKEKARRLKGIQAERGRIRRGAASRETRARSKVAINPVTSAGSRAEVRFAAGYGLKIEDEGEGGAVDAKE